MSAPCEVSHPAVWWRRLRVCLSQLQVERLHLTVHLHPHVAQASGQLVGTPAHALGGCLVALVGLFLRMGIDRERGKDIVNSLFNSYGLHNQPGGEIRRERRDAGYFWHLLEDMRPWTEVTLYAQELRLQQVN